MRRLQYRALFRRLEAETGQSVTWHGCGSFRLAYTEDEMDWLRQTLSVGRALGFNIELVGPSGCGQLHPFYNLDGVIGALHTPDDGHVDPSGVTHGDGHWRAATGCADHPPLPRHRHQASCRPANGRSTEKGDIVCEHVVNAGGTYARQMGEWSGCSCR
jgi:dimethylglycine dehydrogenase